MQAAARQHGGTMTVKWENNWFTVRILLPIPEKRINVRGLLAVCTKNDPSLLVISTGNFDTELKLLQIVPPK